MNIFERAYNFVTDRSRDILMREEGLNEEIVEGVFAFNQNRVGFYQALKELKEGKMEAEPVVVRCSRQMASHLGGVRAGIGLEKTWDVKTKTPYPITREGLCLLTRDIGEAAGLVRSKDSAHYLNGVSKFFAENSSAYVLG